MNRTKRILCILLLASLPVGAISCGLFQMPAANTGSASTQPADEQVIKVVQGVGNEVFPLLPAPIGAIAALVVGLGVSIYRGVRDRNAALAIAKSIEAAKKSGIVNFNDPTAVKVLDTMGEYAKLIVDKAQANAKAESSGIES